MNKTILLFAALLISSCHHLLKPEKVDERCQVVFDKVSKMKVYLYPEIEPKFPGGDHKFLEFFGDNIEFDPNERLIFRVAVQYVVNTEGQVLCPRIYNKPEDQISNTEKSIVRMFAQMPKWEPGKCKGKNVSTLMTTVVRFNPG